MRHKALWIAAKALGVALGVTLLASCEYAGHTVKAQMGRKIGETVAGTEYTVGCEVRFDRRGK